MQAEARATRPTGQRCLAEGVAAGLALTVADLSASGVQRTPWELCVAALGAGLLLGLGAGALGALLRRRGVAFGAVVAVGIALEGLSGLSKELEAGSVRLAAALFVLTVAVLAFVLAAGAAGARRSLAWAWLVIVAIPAGSLLAQLLGRGSTAAVATAAAPLVPLLLWRVRGPGPQTVIATVAALALPLLAVPVTLAERDAPRARVAEAAPSGAGARAPSVVLLVIDTLRADALPEGGALARLAARGVRFDRAISAAPWTLPSVASLLTGLHPSQHGAVGATTPLSESADTLAEILRRAGYATAAFTGGAFVGALHRLDQGFETFDPTAEQRFAPFRVHVPLVWRVAKNRYCPQRWLVRWVDESLGFAGGLAAARAWAGSEPRRPFFLFLHTYQVHDYYLYDPQLDDGVLARDGPPSERFAGRLSVHPRELFDASQAELDRFHALYAERARAVDELLPELERLVAELAGDSPVLWIVTADHGEGFDAARGRVHHGGRLHDDLVRVPLLLRADGLLPAGVVVEEQVSLVDVLPTALELLGLDLPAELPGRSLLGVIEGGAGPAQAWSEERVPRGRLLALRTGGWKRIESPNSVELYDLAADPGETAPLPQDSPELRDACAGFAQRYPLVDAAQIELDAATLEHLRQLGYVH